ncbi:hypothetical protein BDN72DRAFT_778818 [Pluteus cervinus]|uniref:Uncharacterized protein n=1 Tax=Pluteus cervinus TaxID=181527 RepID=A0ACD3A689_9AGAR|nr:hypothetical protein BDN72DRAFT_778818 [Pluteus cervinus]
MHNLFLGEFAHHCRKVWNMNIQDKSTNQRVVEPHDDETQQQMYDKVVNLVKKKKVKPLTRVRKAYLESVAHKNSVVVTAANGGVPTLQNYADALVHWYDTHPEPKPDILIPSLDHNDDTQDIMAEDTVISIDEIMTADIMNEVRSDIAKTTLPSWMERPPHNFGEPSHGKLKADQWRTVCTVNLLITLTRLWGSPPPQDQAEHATEYDLLMNFLDLVIAVDHGTRRSISTQRIEIYWTHIVRYLRGLILLFPNHQFVPNHHLSLHLVECLERFGPVHAWWSFPFERYNGVMGRLKKNFKPNQMEITFLCSFSRGCNLRSLLQTLTPSRNTIYSAFIDKLKDTFLSGFRGTVLSDVLSFSPDASSDDGDLTHPGIAMPTTGDRFTFTGQAKQQRVVPEIAYQKLILRLNRVFGDGYYADYRAVPPGSILLPQNAEFIRKIRIGSGFYNGYSSKCIGNSFIVFRRPSDGTLRAGQIKQLFLHRRYHPGSSAPGGLIIEPFLHVKEYEPLTHDDYQKDVFARIPLIYTWLCYNKFMEEPHVLRASDVVSHFASYVFTPPDIGTECIVVKSLDRVRVSVEGKSTTNHSNSRVDPSFVLYIIVSSPTDCNDSIKITDFY